MEPADPFKLIGTIVDGRYRIERVAGRGGFGVVYRAFHLSFESAIALKVLRLPDDPASERRSFQIASFQREGKVLFELSLLHSSIVRALEAGVVVLFDGSIAPYLALEWLDGVSLDLELKHRRKRGLAPMTFPEVIALLNEPAQALALAHGRGIVHRDIKPGNLFAARTAGGPIVKILDFGIAKLLDDSTSTTTRFAQTGPASSFTPMYAAPEQWLRRLGATGTWTDVHAWALVCVELLTGKVPLMGDETVQYMAACLDSSVRPTPRTIGLELSDEIERVFVRALAVHPRERFRDVGEFWTALRRAGESSSATVAQISVALLSASHDSTDASLTSLAPTDPPEMISTRATASRSVESRGGPGRSPRWGGPLAVGVLAGVVVVLALLVRQSNESTVQAPRPIAQGSDDSRHGVPAQYARPSIAAEVEIAPTEPQRPPAAAVSSKGWRQPREGSWSVGRVAVPIGASDRQEPSEQVLGSAPASAVAIGIVAPLAPSRPDGGTSLEQLIHNEELVHRR